MPNSNYPKVAVQWLNQALCLTDNKVLRNRQLFVAPNRYPPFRRHTLNSSSKRSYFIF
jgi:hypothetical protein